MPIRTSHVTKLDIQLDRLAEYLVRLCGDHAQGGTEMAKTIINVLNALDPMSFNNIQSSILERFPEPHRNNSYLDVCQDIAKAMKLYLVFIDPHRGTDSPRQAMMNSEKNRRILDIGSGSGSFSFVCNALGNNHSTGMDRPQSDSKNDFLKLNYALAKWYGVHVIEHAIERRSPFPLEDRSFDDFVIFHPTFCRAWKEQDWDFLFSDLARCATKKNSRIYMKINTYKMRNSADALCKSDDFFGSIKKLKHREFRDKCYVVNLM